MAWSMGLLGASGAVAAGAYDLLETQVLSTSAASVTFTGLGAYSDYKHLQIRAVLQNAGTTGVLLHENLRFNSDSGTNYAWHALNGSGSSVASSGGTSSNSILIRETSAADAGGSIFGVAVIDILDFSSTGKNTTIRCLSGGLNSSETDITLSSGLWNNTAALTQIELSNFSSLDYQAGSRISLYGVK